MLAFPTLFINLTTTAPMKLLNLTYPAFSSRRIGSRRASPCLPPGTHHSGDPVVEGGDLQDPGASPSHTGQGVGGGKHVDLFKFGEANRERTKVIKIKENIQEKLSMAPVHNRDSERVVGSVNYGLKVRGAKELKAVSSSLVKAKVAELTEGKEVTKEMKARMKKGGAVPQLLEAWE